MSPQEPCTELGYANKRLANKVECLGYGRAVYKEKYVQGSCFILFGCGLKRSQQETLSEF